MRGGSGRKLEIAVWLGLAVVLLVVVALPFAVAVLVGQLQARGFTNTLPGPVQVAIQISDFLLTKWYLIVGAGVAGSIAAALAVWGRRGRAASG